MYRFSRHACLQGRPFDVPELNVGWEWEMLKTKDLRLPWNDEVSWRFLRETKTIEHK